MYSKPLGGIDKFVFFVQFPSFFLTASADYRPEEHAKVEYIVAHRIAAVNTTFMLLGLFGNISPSVAAVLHNASTVASCVKATKLVLDKS